jgi:hypothetical protein
MNSESLSGNAWKLGNISGQQIFAFGESKVIPTENGELWAERNAAVE